MLLGDEVTLTCSSRGGIPPPTMKWYKVLSGSREELPSHTLQYEGVTKAELQVVVDASDKDAEYYCEASNFATETPLNTNTTLTFLRGGQLGPVLLMLSVSLMLYKSTILFLWLELIFPYYRLCQLDVAPGCGGGVPACLPALCPHP